MFNTLFSHSGTESSIKFPFSSLSSDEPFKNQETNKVQTPIPQNWHPWVIARSWEDHGRITYEFWIPPTLIILPISLRNILGEKKSQWFVSEEVAWLNISFSNSTGLISPQLPCGSLQNDWLREITQSKISSNSHSNSKETRVKRGAKSVKLVLNKEMFLILCTGIS